MDTPEEKKLFLVNYRKFNGWKIKNYIGTRAQVDKAIRRLKYDEISIQEFSPDLKTILERYKKIIVVL